MKSRFESLKCTRCGEAYPLETQSRCIKCGGILTAKYSLAGRFEESDSHGIWRFGEVLPPVKQENALTLGEGSTPYVPATGYANANGVRQIMCKLEGCNPTGSFKDRAAALGMSLAREWGKHGVYTASSGNAAAAISAYAARAGMRCVVLIRDDSTAAKISQISLYSPTLLRVHELFDTREDLEAALSATQNALPGWFNHFLWASYNPLLIDGFKTISYELALDGGPVPRYIFVPVAGGDLIYAMYKGFKELKNFGLIDRLPNLVAVQGEGASPTVAAIEGGKNSVPELESAETIAGALKVSFGAEHALEAVSKTSGFGIGVPDDEIIDAQRKVAKLDGIFCEISSATTLAAISKALSTGRIEDDDSVAAILTGVGFKDFRPVSKDPSTIPLAKDVNAIPGALKAALGKY